MSVQQTVLDTINQFEWDDENTTQEFADFLIETSKAQDFDEDKILIKAEAEWNDLEDELKDYIRQAIREVIIPNKNELYPELAPESVNKPVIKAKVETDSPPKLGLKSTLKKQTTKKILSYQKETAPALEDPPTIDDNQVESTPIPPIKKGRVKKFKPHNAYHKYCEDKRPEVRERYKKEGKGDKYSEIERELGAMWKMAKVDQATEKRYEQVAKEYNEAHGFKWKSEQIKPENEKQKMGSYALYYKEMRATVVNEMPELKCDEIMKEVGDRWKVLCDQDKDDWREKADQYNLEHGRKSKQVVEKDKTGKATNAYLVFQSKFRTEYLKDHPDAKDNSDLVASELKKAYAEVRKDVKQYQHYKNLAEEENICRGVVRRRKTVTAT